MLLMAPIRRRRRPAPESARRAAAKDAFVGDVMRRSRGVVTIATLALAPCSHARLCADERRPGSGAARHASADILRHIIFSAPCFMPGAEFVILRRAMPERFR